MLKYKSHKIVEASKIIEVELDSKGQVQILLVEDSDPLGGNLPKDIFSRDVPQVGDYLIRYEDGYLSWSPAEAFENGYTLMDETPSREALDVGHNGEEAAQDGTD